MPLGTQTFALNAGRINKFKGGILSHAAVVEVIARHGRQIEMPKNVGDVIIQRRWLPYGATSSSQNTFFANGTGDRGSAIVNAHLTAEGVTPPSETISSVDVQTIPQQYSCLYAFTDKTFYLHEDDIPKVMLEQIGERVALVNEMIDWGVLRSCTNQFFGGTGTTIATVNNSVSVGMLRSIITSLQRQHAKFVTSTLAASAKYGTDPVAGGYVLVSHTDLEHNFEDLPGFTRVEKYASGRPMEHEIGKVGKIRIVLSPDLPAFQDAGAAIGATGCASTTGVNIDVYPFVVYGKDAWSQLSVRGLSALNPTYLPPTTKSKSDPFGQRGLAGTMWWKAATVENSGWMAVGFVGLKSEVN